MRWSRVIYCTGVILFWISIVAIFLLFSLTTFAGVSPDRVTLFGVEMKWANLSSSFQLVLLAAIGLFLWLFVTGAMHFLRLFQSFSKGKLFCARSTVAIKGLARIILAGGVLHFVLPIALLPFVGSFAAETRPSFGVSLSFNGVFMGLLVYLIAWVMDEGRKLREDADLTV